jgi:transcriptional regulator with AAA-type ATPase domain
MRSNSFRKSRADGIALVVETVPTRVGQFVDQALGAQFEMPPLRERSEDIPLLVGYFPDRYARKAERTFRG